MRKNPVLWTLATLLYLPIVPAAAQTGLDMEVGKVEYETSCASCHGRDGTGKGPIAGYLKVRPADLTRLARENGGIYPMDRVVEIIDGRKQVAVHGERTMPVWGARYLTEFEMFGGEQDDKALVAERIGRLAHYLELLQRY